jgi:hypothetical protein
MATGDMDDPLVSSVKSPTIFEPCVHSEQVYVPMSDTPFLIQIAGNPPVGVIIFILLGVTTPEAVKLPVTFKLLNVEDAVVEVAVK